MAELFHLEAVALVVQPVHVPPKVFRVRVRIFTLQRCQVVVVPHMSPG
jgi:hypothetical protein